METIELTRKEFRKRFEIEFKYLSRALKENGNYKFIMHYLFSHDNKCKDDLFKTMCSNVRTADGILFYPSLKVVLDYLPLIGFTIENYHRGNNSEYWKNNIGLTSYYLHDYPSDGFINFNVKIRLID